MRSYLFVPGDRPERFAKAIAAGADVTIFDLEDAVAPANKVNARKNIAQAIEDGARVVVRINAASSPEFAADLVFLSGVKVNAVMLPKAESAETIAKVREASNAPVIALIETALGIWNVMDVAKATGVERLAFGSIDYQVDVGSAGTDQALLFARSQLVLASKVAGIQAPIDGVSVVLDDAQTISAEAMHSKELGFAGKLCIHPKQVNVVNKVFSPTEQELDWAKRVVAATDKSGGAAVSVDGAMVDLPVLIKAQNLLAMVC